MAMRNAERACAESGIVPPSAIATTRAATTKKLASRRRATSLCGLPKCP
jgi:hypothetical protein